MEVEETACKIKSMEIRGAGRIARAASAALQEFVLQYEGKDVVAFKNDIAHAVQLLKNTRPTAVSLSNAIRFTIKGIEDLEDIETVRQKINTAAYEFINWSNSAVEQIEAFAFECIPENAVILTHCNSSVVVSALVHAHKNNKNIKIYARETRPWFQGRITAQELAKAGIPVTLIVDSAARYVMEEVDIVMIGADTVEANGDVVNKIGTCGLAVIANEFKVPFYVCAETYKFSPDSLSGRKTILEERSPDEIADPSDLPGVTIFNPVFDVTPAKHIKNIICEKGIISTTEVEDIIKNLYH